MNEMDLETAMKAIMAAKRAETESADPADVLSFRAGLLTQEDRDVLLEQAAAAPETIRALIDASRFPDVEPIDERQRVNEEDVTRQWRRFQERLHQEGRRRTSEAPSAPPTPRHAPAAPPGGSFWPPLSSLRFAQAAATVLLVVSLGLSWALGMQRSQVARPRLNLPIVELAPASESGERTTAEQVRIPAGADGIVLSLALLERRSYPVYEIEIQDSAGGRVWSSTALLRASAGIFTLELPRGFLPAGDVRIALWGIDGDQRDPLAVYKLAVEDAADP